MLLGFEWTGGLLHDSPDTFIVDTLSEFQEWVHTSKLGLYGSYLYMTASALQAVHSLPFFNSFTSH